MSARGTARVVGIGEVLWDCFPEGRRPGGAPANVAYHAMLLGHEGLIASRVGSDAAGRDLLAALASRGLDVRGVQEDPRHPTGRVTVDTGDPSAPRFTIHEDVAWDHLEFDESLATVLHDARAICFGSLAQRTATTRSTIRRALDAAAGALKVFDVNLRGGLFDREVIEQSLDRADLVKLNEDEAAVLIDRLDLPPTGWAAVLRERHDVDAIAVTRGENGCLFHEGDQTIDCPGRPVELADAVGAGDAFTAALIAARLWAWDGVRTVGFANAVGALVAGHPGAMPALSDPYADLIERWAGNPTD